VCGWGTSRVQAVLGYDDWIEAVRLQGGYEVVMRESE